MPPTKKKVAPSPTAKLLAKKLDELHETMMEIRDDVDAMRPPSGIKRSLGAFGGGVLRGLGFIFGTTIVVAGLVYLFSLALKTDAVQDWFTNQISNIFQQSIENAVDDIEIKLF